MTNDLGIRSGLEREHVISFSDVFGIVFVNAISLFIVILLSAFLFFLLVGNLSLWLVACILVAAVAAASFLEALLLLPYTLLWLCWRGVKQSRSHYLAGIWIVTTHLLLTYESMQWFGVLTPLLKVGVLLAGSAWGVMNFLLWVRICRYRRKNSSVSESDGKVLFYPSWLSGAAS